MKTKRPKKTRRTPRRRPALACVSAPSASSLGPTSREIPGSPSSELSANEARLIGIEALPPTLDEPEVLDVRRASHIVGLSPATLNTLRSRGGGPLYAKVGRRVVYRVKDLRAWRDARLRSSTAG